MKIIKRIVVSLVCLVLVLVLVVGGYVAYVALQYSRIEDETVLEVQNPQNQMLQTGRPYTAATYNIGFGAYNHQFSFFMDEGFMQDGTAVSGNQARAASPEVVQTNTRGAIAQLETITPDFCLLQEVDVKADRSHAINQVQMIQEAFGGYASVYASNFHSAYLAYPLHQPIGSTQSGLLTLSRYQVEQSVRRSYPVDTGFPTKFFDLDRCFTLLRLPVQSGGELVLINTHMSAYDEGGKIRAAQMEMLAGVLQQEYQKGNWVIVGGDFNHALCGTVQAFASQQLVPPWVAVFDESMLPGGFGVVCAGNATQVATCRSTDMPYQEGVNYSTVLDGFIVSNNVQATALNIDAGFAYSDHNPVQLQFTLL